MKLLCTQLLLLTALVCVPFASAQDQSAETLTPAATKYSFTTIAVPGAVITRPYAINNQGNIVGAYFTCASGCLPNGFINVKGKYTTMNCVLENETQLSDINNKGEIVGTYGGNDGGNIEGFIWGENGQCTTIADPNGPARTNVWGVNDNGVIVGYWTDASQTVFHAFSYDGTFTEITCPGAVTTRAYGIAGNGTIVGDYQDVSGGAFHGLVYQNGKCKTVDVPVGVSTFLRGINVSGQISGIFEDSSGAFHGFVKTGDVFQKVDAPHEVNEVAFHMNNNGILPGYYTNATGGTVGFKATPLP